LKELDKYLQQHQCLYVKLDPYWLYHLYDKDIVPFEGREKNDALVNLFKSHGYEHHGFTTEYDTSSQVRWMGVLNLEGKTPETLKKTFDSQRKRNINKAINYGVKVRFLERDEFNLFLDLYRETEERAGFVSKTDDYFYNFIDTYGDKVLVPLAYIDLDEYVLK
ncbi:glycine glycyltransferase FemB, partial [Staphylococcus aureus]|nr:glycine glycyltransferase FemB [Staphylococcus aureus]